ncbi:tetratricopeptide repeat protein [Actinoplanes sp. NPDC048988]|uniref:tetratricopeptide repeat protein n=1 Tax=Actinoplanes sp. NPDC048988 TaxID=3363901 RepID=UPI00371CCF7C
MRSEELSSLNEPVLDWPVPCDLADLDERYQRLYVRIAESDPALLAATLDDVAAQCRSGDPATIRVYAAGLLAADRPHQAVSVLHRLTETHPDDVPARVDLARADIAVGFLDDAAAQLTTAAGLAGELPGARHEIRRRIDGLAAWRRWMTLHLRFHELRVAAFRERAEAGSAGADPQAARAYSLLLLERNDEATAVLETARRAAPRHERTLELLTMAYLHAGRTEDWHRALRELEQVAPHSQVVELLGDQRDRDVEVFDRDQNDLLQVLTQRALSGDAEAIETLRGQCRRNPGDRTRANLLMFAEMAHGDLDAAVRLADQLAALDDPGHSLHYNMAQVYWRAGRLADARRQLDLADRTAADAQDRAEAARLRASLEEKGCGA